MKIGMGLPINQRSGAFSPSVLFASGEVGDWFDPSDLSRLFQDGAGTTPVTADGQEVGRMIGQKGNVILTAAIGKKPLYKTSGGLHWLQFDGTDDGFASSTTLNMTGTDEVTFCLGIRKLSDAAVTVPLELGPDAGGATGAFYLASPRFPSEYYQMLSRGTGTSVSSFTASGAAPDTAVVTGLAKISGDTTTIRRNGVAATDATDQGTGNYSDATLYVGNRAGTTFFLNGNIYFLLVRGSMTSGGQLSDLESFAARKCGVTI